MPDYMISQEYLEYLIKNCGVRGYDFEERSEMCLRPDVDVIMRYVRWLDVDPRNSILEVGSGLGRILKELHEEFQVRPSGIDSFPRVAEEARKRVGAICDDIRVSAAEAIDFPDATFDRIMCWGVFDLTEQSLALKEMARVLKHGGKLMLTGKSDHFESDDTEAFLAERGSRRKGIPNHYTDFDALIAWGDVLGLAVERHRFFRRRGDLMLDRFVDVRPARFYEYLVVFSKASDEKATGGKLPLVGRAESREFSTWVNEHGA